MTEPPKKKPAPLTDFGAPLFPGDRLPTPQVVEANTDSAWALFKELQDGGDGQAYADTARQGEMAKAPAAKPGPHFADTEPAGTLAPLPATPVSGPLTLDSVMVEVRRSNRVCPQLQQWQILFGMLLDKARALGKSPPTPPFSGPAWESTSFLSKRLCLR
ncbi:MAG: hypothetical protein EOO54_05130, partial [Haliea sp.]